jgi:hypothetical protein
LAERDKSRKLANKAATPHQPDPESGTALPDDGSVQRAGQIPLWASIALIIILNAIGWAAVLYLLL